MRRFPLMTVTDPQQISSGLLPDRHELFLPFWLVAANVRFYQGKVRRLIPAALAYTPVAGAKGRGLHQQQNSDGVRWLFSAVHDGANMRIHRWYGPAAEQVESVAQPRDDTLTQKAAQVDFTQWGNWTLWNYGVPEGLTRRYRPGTGVDMLPNAPGSIGIVKKQNQLIAIGTGAGRKGVAWSHADNIELWAAESTNLAGSMTIEELNTPIRSYARLGQNIAVYSEDQMGIVRYVGRPFVYGQQVLLDGIGAVGKTAVVADGRLNYGVSRNGLWQTDGNEFRYIDQGMLSDYLQENVNWQQAGKIVAARNDVTRCVEFHFPMLTGTTENSEGWAFDPSTGAWSPVPAFQSMQERVLLDKPIASKDGSVFMLDTDLSGGGALDLRSKPFLVQNENGLALHQNSIIDEVELALKAASGIEFRIGAAEDIDGPWEYTAWVQPSTDMRTYRMPHLPTGTFHKIEFRSTVANWSLDLQGIAFYGQIDGVKRDAL